MKPFVTGVILLSVSFQISQALNVVIAGGTGKIGQLVASKLSDHKVTILSRNAYLARAPNRVTEAFGWVGKTYLERYPHISLRDWDGKNESSS